MKKELTIVERYMTSSFYKCYSVPTWWSLIGGTGEEDKMWKIKYMSSTKNSNNERQKA